ncbi:MAG TPA: cohesin domain-containing protein [Anaerolineales bacterium]|nr:cohesin domain-containing protein [Anaerolineales bacterium]
MNKKYLLLLFAFLAGLVLTITVAITAARAGTAVLSLEPQAITLGPNETVSMTVNLESAVQVVGAEIYLAYDASILDVLDADNGTDLIQIYPGNCPQPEFVILNEADLLSGTISYAAVDLGAEAGCTSGLVASIEFQCVGLGTSNVTFGPDTALSDPEGVSVTLTTEDAAITCTDVTSTPGPTATFTASPTLTPTATATPPGAFLPVIGRDFTATPTPTNTPTATPTPWTTILSDNFEGDFPGSWNLWNNNGNLYQFGKRNCHPYLGTYSAWIIGGGSVGSGLNCQAIYPNSITTWMVHGPFSLVGAQEAELNFQIWFNTEYYWDRICYVASGIGGSDPSNYDGWCWSDSSTNVAGNVQGWVFDSLDLSDVTGTGSVNLLGDSSVYTGFVFFSDDTNNLTEGAYVDDVVIRKCSSNCTVGQNLAITNVNKISLKEALAQQTKP